MEVRVASVGGEVVGVDHLLTGQKAQGIFLRLPSVRRGVGPRAHAGTKHKAARVAKVIRFNMLFGSPRTYTAIGWKWYEAFLGLLPQLSAWTTPIIVARTQHG